MIKLKEIYEFFKVSQDQLMYYIVLDLKQQDLKLTFKVKQTVGTKLFADLWMANLMVVSTQTR
jgi:hypothetical protein